MLAARRETRLFTGFREVRVLAQESVAWMNGLRAAVPRGIENLVHAQVALADRRRAEQDALVRVADMQRVGIGLGINRNRADAELVQSAGDAARDDAAIGDQDFSEHHSQMSRRTGVGL